MKNSQQNKKTIQFLTNVGFANKKFKVGNTDFLMEVKFIYSCVFMLRKMCALKKEKKRFEIQFGKDMLSNFPK